MRLADTGQRNGLLLACCTAVISGVAIFVNSYGVKAVGNPTAYTTAKNAVSAVVLVAIVLTLSGSRSTPVVTRPATAAQWAGLAAVGVLGGAVAFVLFFEGLAHSSSVHAAFLQKTLVFWVALLAVPLLRERVGVLQAAAIGLLVVGQAMIGDGVGPTLRMPFGRGEVMILAATVLWSIEVVIVKLLLADLSSWTVGVTRMTLGSVLLAVWLAIRGEFHVLTGLDGHQWAWVIATGGILAAYVATWFAALALARAVDVTAVLVAGAIVTAVLNTVWEHQALRPQLGGLAVVAVGAAVVLVQAARRGRTAVAVT